MANHATTLQALEQSLGETIEAIVVGKHDDAAWSAPPLSDEHVLLSREAGLAKLDAEYDNGYGGADCFPFWAWTASRVFFVTEYDGATSIAWVPRAPVAGAPDFSGQST